MSPFKFLVLNLFTACCSDCFMIFVLIRHKTCIQRVQFSAASFVTGRYVNDCSVIQKLGWLPIKQQRDFNHLKLVHKAIYNYDWPSYLRLNIVQNVRCLRSSNVIRLVTPIETGTFQDTSAKLFNELPSSIRQCQDFSTFIRLLKGHFATSKDTQN